MITSSSSLPAEEVTAGVCVPKLNPPIFGASAGLLAVDVLVTVGAPKVKALGLAGVPAGVVEPALGKLKAGLGASG